MQAFFNLISISFWILISILAIKVKCTADISKLKMRRHQFCHQFFTQSNSLLLDSNIAALGSQLLLSQFIPVLKKPRHFYWPTVQYNLVFTFVSDLSATYCCLLLSIHPLKNTATQEHNAKSVQVKHEINSGRQGTQFCSS